MSKHDEFCKQINAKIAHFNTESKEHKYLHRRFRYSIFMLAGLTSVLSGLALSFTNIQVEINVVIIVVGALTGIVTSIEGVRRPQDLWLMERNVYYALLDLKEDYEFEMAGQQPVNVDSYHNKMQQILNSSKEKWFKKISQEKPEPTESLVETKARDIT